MDFQVQQLIAELNEILAHETVDESGGWKQKLVPQSLQLFELLPSAIQDQLLLERDPHGNVQVIIAVYNFLVYFCFIILGIRILTFRYTFRLPK